MNNKANNKRICFGCQVVIIPTLNIENKKLSKYCLKCADVFDSYWNNPINRKNERDLDITQMSVNKRLFKESFIIRQGTNEVLSRTYLHEAIEYYRNNFTYYSTVDKVQIYVDEYGNEIIETEQLLPVLDD